MVRAVAIAAGVVGDTDVIALVAFFDMAAEHGCAANLNGAHHAQLFARQFVRGAVSLSVLSKNVGQLESRPVHAYLFGKGGFWLRCSSRSSGLTVPATICGETCV